MIAQVAPPLTAAAGFPWGNLLWVLLGITVFLFALAGFGRLLAATHPEPKAPVAPPPEVAPDVAVVIAAAVYAALGGSARIMSVVPKDHLSLSVDSLMLQWSLEGRREIYTSHRVR